MAAHLTRAFPSRLLQIALIVAFLLPIVAHAYAGHDSRYMADDYCTAAIATRDGVGASLDYWYQHWSGRYTAITLLAALGQQPPQSYAVIVPLLLALWLAASIWTLSRLFALIGARGSGGLAILFAALLSYALLDGLPNAVQSIYWVTSAITYLLPLIGLMAYCGLTLVMLRQSRSPLTFAAGLAGALGLLLIAAGCSETYAALQLTLLALLLIGGWLTLPVTLRPRLTIWLALGLLVTLIGLAIMLRAPGNSVRQSYFEPIAPLLIVIERSVTVTVAYLFFALWRFTVLPLLAVLGVAAAAAYLTPIPARVGRLSRGFVRRGLLLTLGLTLLVMAATIAPSVYALSTPPPARAFVLAQFALASGTALWGVLIGWGLQTGDRQGRLRRSKAFAYGGSLGLAALLIVGPLAGAARTLAQGREFDSYAREWDAQDRDIRAARARGETSLVIAPLSIDMAAAANLDPINTDVNSATNACASRYYNLESLRVQ